MKMRFGFTTKLNDPLCGAIRRITGGRASHVFLVFYQDHGDPFYFESIWKKDPMTGRDGVRGPIQLSRIEEWMAEDLANHLFWTKPEEGFLPLTVDEVDQAYVKLCDAVHRVRYAKLQLAQNWLEARTGVSVAWKMGSVENWTCSETCVRVMPPRLWDCFDLLNLNADRIAPSGDRLMSVETATSRMMVR